MKNKDARIAIIGAGPSGLSAAEALKEKSYNNVVVFEKNKRVGGMAMSKTYKTADNRDIVYDLGSIQPLGSKKFFKLMKDHDIHLGREFYNGKNANIRVYSCKERKFIIDFSKYLLGIPFAKMPLALYDLPKILSVILKYRKLAYPGFTKVHNEDLEELSTPFTTWLEKQKFNIIGRILWLVAHFSLNGATYERVGDHSIILVLKNFIHEVFNPPYRYISGIFLPAKEGYQELWNKVAMGHDVRLSSNITKIDRKSDSKIKIYVNDKEEIVDHLIVACSPANLMDIMDYSKDELEVFSKIRNSPVWTAIFLGKAKGVKPLFDILIDEVEDPSIEPSVAEFTPCGQVKDDIWLYQAFIALNTRNGIKEALDRSKIMLKEHFDIEVVDWIDQMYWSQYNSHFSCLDVKQGIFSKAESLQNKLNSFYTGELFAGNTNGKCFDYSHDLVNRFF